MAEDYLASADVWTILDLIVAEWESDPTSQACFDSRIVARAKELRRLGGHRDDERVPPMQGETHGGGG